MTLFGIGPMELMLILVVALIIFGPKRLPEIARSIGKAINDFRRASENVTSTVMRELDVEEQAQKVSEDLRRASESVSSAASALAHGLEVAPLAEPEAEQVTAASPAIRPVHSIPLDAVGKVQVVEEPAVAEAPSVVDPTEQQAAASEDQSADPAPEGQT